MLKNILSAFLFFVNMSIFAVLNEKSDKRYGTYNAPCQQPHLGGLRRFWF